MPWPIHATVSNCIRLPCLEMHWTYICDKYINCQSNGKFLITLPLKHSTEYVMITQHKQSNCSLYGRWQNVLHFCDFQGHYTFVQVVMRLLVGFFAWFWVSAESKNTKQKVRTINDLYSVQNSVSRWKLLVYNVRTDVQGYLAAAAV